MQNDDSGELHPVAFASKVLTTAERKLSISHKELIAVKYFCEKFRTYLLNHKFTVIVDNSALLHLETYKHEQSAKIWRWFEVLQNFRFDVIYKPSKVNPADAPSRLVMSDDPNLSHLPGKIIRDYPEKLPMLKDINNTICATAYPVPSSNISLPVVLPITAEAPVAEAEQHVSDVSSTLNNTVSDVASSPELENANSESKISPLLPKPEVANLENDITLNITNSEGMMIKCTNDTIKVSQRKDAVISTVIKWLETDTRPSSSRDLSPDLYTYYNSYNRLTLINDILHRTWHKTSKEMTSNLICIPLEMQDNVIRLCHDIPMSAHMGKEKTRLRLQSRFYFPRLQEKVDLFIDSCHLCHKRKRNQKSPRAALSPFNGAYPNHILEIDLMEALPNSNRYHAILVMIDRFTMWVEAVPLRSTKVEYIAKAILNNYIARHGCPSRIHSDRGANLSTAHIMIELYKLMGITSTTTTAFAPSQNGGCERVNGTIKNLLWNYCQNDPKNWTNCLSQVVFAYNTSIHNTTGYSPFFLKHGSHPRLPTDIVMGVSPEVDCSTSYGEFANHLYKKLKQI